MKFWLNKSKLHFYKINLILFKKWWKIKNEFLNNKNENFDFLIDRSTLIFCNYIICIKCWLYYALATRSQHNYDNPLRSLCLSCYFNHSRQIWSPSGIENPFIRDVDLLSTDNLCPSIKYVTIVKSLHFLHGGYNHSHLQSRRFRFEKNCSDTRRAMHYRTLLLFNVPNLIRSDGCRHLIATVFGENDRIDKIWDRNGLDRTFEKSSQHLPFNPIHQTYLVMNQAIML